MDIKEIGLVVVAVTFLSGSVACGKKESSSTGGSARPASGELNPKSDRMAMPPGPGKLPSSRPSQRSSM